MPDDVLVVEALLRSEDGHDYVLSRWPEKIELAVIMDVLPTHSGAVGEVVDDLLYTGHDKISVRGLTLGARPRVEKAIYDILSAAHAARMDTTGPASEWVEQRAQQDADAETAIRASLDRLSPDLP